MNPERTDNAIEPASQLAQKSGGRRTRGGIQRGWRCLVLLGPSVAIMGATFWLGTGRAAGPQTRSALERFLFWIAPGLAASLPAAALDTANYLFRKGSHFWGYALLGAMNARAARGLLPKPASRNLALPWAAATAWAAVDEVHQSFSPTRTGTAADVCLDSAGAAAGVILYLLWTHQASRHSHRSSGRGAPLKGN